MAYINPDSRGITLVLVGLATVIVLGLGVMLAPFVLAALAALFGGLF